MNASRDRRVYMAHAAVYAAFAVVACLTTISCSDAASPPPIESTLRILPLADSVFEGDIIRLTAEASSRAGASGPTKPIAWTAADTTLAQSLGDGTFALLRSGTVRITARNVAAIATYDLTIGRLVAKSVEVEPGNLTMGRGDRLSLSARVLGQGGRVVSGRSVAFTSDDTLVAIIGGVGYPPEYLRAVGSGATTIHALVDGLSGTATVSVVKADTAYALTHYNGSPLPVLVAADTVMINGQKEFDEVYADSGTLVLSGVVQKRYQIDVRYTQYHVIRDGETVTRVPRFAQREFDRGLVTVGADGRLDMESEYIYPLAHTAVPDADAYIVHFRIPGDDSFLDLRYRLVSP